MKSNICGRQKICKESIAFFRQYYEICKFDGRTIDYDPIAKLSEQPIPEERNDQRRLYGVPVTAWRIAEVLWGRYPSWECKKDYEYQEYYNLLFDGYFLTACFLEDSVRCRISGNSTLPSSRMANHVRLFMW